ncbi:uncharacterized protein FIBRA_02453 [Fibroporia radiculosa]|uniref:Uncharacterized protein n=1 Tax=Fibroporia radiculosa TaxID=599839 RepID=J4G1P7_9APHY|nr:uncharacterized protein FIBRA_02453 [Fibroporia radiculosa]CCM00423.1 predicted protein [Fibroporia radiculosa]
MSSSASSSFPAPVGGAPIAIDFAPSIVFVCLYIACLPLAISRIANKRTRTFILVGTTVLSLERVVNFALRAAASRNPAGFDTKNNMDYFQSSYGTGYLGLGQDVMNVLRAYLVGTTRPRSMRPAPPCRTDTEQAQKPLAKADAGDADAVAAGAGTHVQELSVSDAADAPDEPRRRVALRALFGGAMLLYILAMVLVTISGGDYWNGTRSAGAGALVQYTRCVRAAPLRAATAEMLDADGRAVQGTNAVAIWAWRTRPARVGAGRVLFVSFITCLLCIPATYRLVVMQYHSSGLLSTGPSSLNMPLEKAGFYALHEAPAWIAVVLLLSVDVRRRFHTGLKGDLSILHDRKPVGDGAS